MELNPVGSPTERYYGNLDVPEGGYVGNAGGLPLIIFDYANEALQFGGTNILGAGNITATGLDIAGIGTFDKVVIDGTVDIGLDMSGGTFATAAIVIPDAAFIGSASGTDAIQIEADGNIVLSQNLLVSGIFESIGIATLADASTLKTSAAPTADAEIANKKYVDDEVAGGGGGGSPGGADTQVQYNNSGAFGGDATFNFNDTTKILDVDGLTVSGTTAIGLDMSGGTFATAAIVTPAGSKSGFGTATPNNTIQVKDLINFVDNNNTFLWTNSEHSAITTALRNIGIGNIAGRNLTTGEGNVLFGRFCGKDLTTGNFNFALGSEALSSLTVGGSNVAIGASALKSLWSVNSNLASSNVALGAASMFAASEALGNVCIGSESGSSLSTGSTNVFLGFNSGRRQITNSNLLIIDNRLRGSAAAELTDTLIYGVMNATPASQTIRFNVSDLIQGNPVHSDADGGGAMTHSWIREDGVGSATTAATLTVSHDGSGANDELGKMVLGVNTGAGVVDVLKLDSDLLATFAGQMATPVGSEAAPSYAFTGQLDDGMWSPAAGELAWSLGGSEEMRLNSTGLGIGITPENTFHLARANAHNQIYLDNYDSAATTNWLQFRKSRSDTLGTKTTTLDGDPLGRINWRGVDSGGNFDVGAKIEVTQVGASGATVPCSMNFATWNTGAENSNQLFLNTNSRIGFSEGDPETLVEMTSSAPYFTFHHSVHEDLDGGGESKLIFKREDGAGTETETGTITISHDGSGANDQLGKMVLGVNTGSGVVDVIEIDSGGTLVFLNSGGLVFGHMYTNNEPIAVTLTAQNTWYELDGANAWTTGLLKNCSFTDPEITVLEPGVYEITWTLSTDFSTTPGAAQQIEFGIMIDGSIQNEGQAHRTLQNSTDTGHCSGTALLDLADNAVISLAARNITSAGKIIHVEHGNMTVKQIGGT